jgi:hypothetical protein
VREHGWEYRRRRPEGTVLYEAVRDNLATLLSEAREVGRGLPRYVERDFARYLECGVLAHGFARVRCESYKDDKGGCTACPRAWRTVQAPPVSGPPWSLCTSPHPQPASHSPYAQNGMLGKDD